MKHIASRDNLLFKRLRRLADGRAEHYADATGSGQVVMLEGVHLCQAWLLHHGLPDIALFDQNRLQTNPEVAALFSRVPDARRVTLEPALSRQLSDVGHGQGVYAVVRVPEPDFPETITENCLWLDHVQDPGNVGTLLRTAAAAGIGRVFLGAGCAGVWSPKVVRSGQGAHFVLTLHEGLDLPALVGRLRIPLLATALGPGAKSLYSLALPAHVAWVAGNEGQGIDPALLKLASQRVFIPQEPAVESLNVAIATGICLFEQRRQWLAALSS